MMWRKCNAFIYSSLFCEWISYETRLKENDYTYNRFYLLKCRGIYRIWNERSLPMKKRLSIFLISILMLSASFVFADKASADTTNNWMFYGSACTDNKYAASTINYIFAKYPNGTQWKGNGQCYGYALKICDILSAKQKEEHYDNLRFTKKNLIYTRNVVYL